MHSSQAQRSSFQRYRIFARVGVVTIMAISLTLAHLHQAAEARAAVATQNLAKTLCLNVESLIDKIDIALQESADEIARQTSLAHPDREALDRYLTRQRDRLPEVAFMWASNERGDIVFRVDTGPAPANIGDRDYFIRLRDQPNAGVVVSRPVLGRISHQWVWPIARRISKPDGSFGGVVFASVRVDQIESMFSRIELDANGSVAIRDTDLGLIGRYPPASTINVPIGDRHVSTPYLEALRTNPIQGSYVSGATSIDDISRIHSYRRNSKYGYLVNVGIAEQNMLAGWHKQAWIISGLAAAFILALLFFSRLMERAWQRQEQDLAALRAGQRALLENEQQLETILNKIPESVILLAADGSVVRANPATFKLPGLSNGTAWTTLQDCFRQFVCTYPDGRLLSSEDWPAVRALKGETVDDVEICVNHTDSGAKWIALLWAVPIRHQGQTQALVGIQDITARKRDEEALRIAALVYLHSSEGMLVTDAGNRIIAVNDAYTRLTGFAEHEVMGRIPHVLSAELQSPDAWQAMRDCLDTTGYWQGEISKPTKRGAIIVVRLTINTVRDAAGRPAQRVILFSDVTEKKRADSLISDQANFDMLTKLPNRRLFGERLQHHLAQARQVDAAVGLLLIDLDQFKEVNDTLGHDKGDMLLIEVAQRIAACLRPSVTLARLGGDEFTIILTHADDIANAKTIARQIIAALTAPFDLGVDKVFISASIGIAEFPEAGTELEDLLRHADQAMYAAKNAGRNRYACFSRELQEATQLRVGLTSDLRNAQAANQFEVYYQPIVDLESGRIRKAEALIRWRHPLRGMVSPVDFIPLAEVSGMILDIGEWVFKQAAAQVKRLRELADPAFQISVNISPMQFRNDDNLKDTWLNHLAALGLPAQSMVIEITEGLLLDLSAEVRDKLHAFGDAGIQVALDDFGTGYSSLAYLKKFDIDYLKIDRAFVNNLETDSDNRALCEAIIIMAHKLGLTVIAEGIETAAQRDLLKAAHCDFGQGYLFSRPVPAVQFEALLMPLTAI